MILHKQQKIPLSDNSLKNRTKWTHSIKYLWKYEEKR